MSVLSVKNLEYAYSKGTPFQIGALKGVSVDFNLGEIVGVIGHTGSGKSTLLQHLNGLLKPESGEIFFEDDIMVTDTAGFTSLDEKLLPIAYYELPYYYPDFVAFLNNCKYKSCVHYNEKIEECAVKRAVCDGLIDKQRFLRYKQIYKILNEKWVRTHG